MSHLQILPSIRERVDPLVERFLDMREKFRWMMGVGGERVLLYKRKTAGEICPNFDRVRKQHRSDLADGCYGTNFLGGYFGPFEIYASISTVSPGKVRVYEHGLRREFTPTGSWGLWEPKLENKDFIVRRNGERLWITEVQETKWRHHILRQLFKVEEIERNNPIYSIPIAGIPDA